MSDEDEVFDDAGGDDVEGLGEDILGADGADGAEGADPVDDAEVDPIEDDGEERPARKRGRSAGADAPAREEDTAAFASPKARSKVRDELTADVEAFLKAGGKIQAVDPEVRADPPRKPQSNYGSRSI